MRCRAERNRASADGFTPLYRRRRISTAGDFMRTIVMASTALLLSTAAFAATQPEKDIARGFMHLGMNTRRAACYGAVIGGKLHGQNLARAAQIVQSAKNSGDVRKAVQSSGVMIEAFSAAHNQCDRQATSQ
jgi:hypothetical protein